MAPYGSFLTALASGLAFASTAYAGFKSTSSNNIAVYWGQNSYGQASGPNVQERLAYYCENSDIDIIPISFLNSIANPTLVNFANAGDNCTAFVDNQELLDCPQIEDDIITCQKAGKTIILSIGGATYTQGGFPTAEEAKSAANLVWATFGPVPSGVTLNRPFGNAVVDGFDFDFESTFNNLLAFGTELRRLMDAATAGGDKQYVLAAAPQCVYPDAANHQILDSQVPFDFLMVQYYNNFCGVNNFEQGAASQTKFNFNEWDNWAKNVSKNPDVKVLLGIPANSGAAGSGYTVGAKLEEAIKYSKKFKSFGGVMMWDTSQLWANTGYLAQVVSHCG